MVWKFFSGRRLDEYREKVQSLQANSGVACMLSGASQGRPVIVGWSIAPCGQVIEENLGQLLKKLTAGPRVCQGPNHHAANWGRNRVDHRTITGRSWDNFGPLEASMPLQ